MLHDVTVFVWLLSLIVGSELDLSAPRSKSNVVRKEQVHVVRRPMVKNLNAYCL